MTNSCSWGASIWESVDSEGAAAPGAKAMFFSPLF
jgi:hypothetical protein